MRNVVDVRDSSDAEPVARIHLEVFERIRPASTLIQIGSALRPWQLVEIEACAIVP